MLPNPSQQPARRAGAGRPAPRSRVYFPLEWENVRWRTIVKNLERQRAELVLRHQGWLAERPRAFQDLVLARCELMKLKPTQIVYELGDEAGGLYGLVEGHVGVHLAVRGLDPSLGFVGRPGFWAGDAAAVRGAPRLVTIVANTRCRIFRLRRAELLLIAQRDPLVWAHVALLMGHTVERCVNIIDALKRHDPVARVAAMLLSLIADVPQLAPVIRVSQAELGSMTSLGRGSVNAALRELQERRLIRRRYRSIEVMNARALGQFAGRAERKALRTAAA